MMKKFFVLMAVFSVSTTLRAGKGSQLDCMIIASLNSYVEHIHERMERGVIPRERTCRHYVCMDGLPDSFPYDSLQYAVYFSKKNMKGYTRSFEREIKKGFQALFAGLKLTDNRIVIKIRYDHVRLTDKNYFAIGISDWGVFTYEYDCDVQEWELTDTKYGGI
jgi:hypothetical protein